MVMQNFLSGFGNASFIPGTNAIRPNMTENRIGIPNVGSQPSTGLTGQDFISSILENPELAFFSTLQNRNLSPVQRQFFQTQLPQFQNRYLGNVGNLLRGGTSLENLPSLQDFLGDINFRNEFMQIPQSLRPGASQARFAPPTRFLF